MVLTWVDGMGGTGRIKVDVEGDGSSIGVGPAFDLLRTGVAGDCMPVKLVLSAN